MSKRLLWIVPKLPLPANDGARIATVALLSRMRAMGFETHLLVISEETPPSSLAEELSIESVSYCEPRFKRVLDSVSSLLSTMFAFLRNPRLAITQQRYSSAKIRRAIFDIIAEKDIDTIVFDGMHTASAFAEFAGGFTCDMNQQIVYRAHNREAQIWQRKAATCSGILKRMFFSQQAHCVRRFENSLVSASALVATVSATDVKEFQKDVPEALYQVVPIGQDFSQGYDPVKHTQRVLFVGNLNWQPNREGLEWFLSKVWPVVKQKSPDLRVDIVGSGDTDWLHTYQKQDGVEVHGKVPCLDDFYARACVCLIPVFYGSGTRVKAIEAARYGRPCLSTAVGIEGLPLRASESYLNAETVDEWITVLTTLEERRLVAIAHEAHAAMAPLYDTDNCAALLRNSLLPSSLKDVA